MTRTRRSLLRLLVHFSCVPGAFLIGVVTRSEHAFIVAFAAWLVAGVIFNAIFLPRPS
jgi:uncharacterized membrane protein YoaK (UPF0700 family)